MRKNVLFLLLSVIFVLACVCIMLMYFILRKWDARYIVPVESRSLEYIVSEVYSESREAVPDAKININKASKEELEALPGIGAALAERIIEYREQNGGFRSIEEITEVRGIGQGKLDAIRDLITVEQDKR